MDEGIKIIDNMEIHENEKFVLIVVNSKIYPLPVVHSAAYIMTDKAYIILDGDPDGDILIQIRPKDANSSLEALGRKFSEELLNYSTYMIQSERNRELRNIIFQKALSIDSNPVAESRTNASHRIIVANNTNNQEHHPHTHDPDVYGTKYKDYFKKDKNEQNSS